MSNSTKQLDLDPFCFVVVVPKQSMTEWLKLRSQSVKDFTRKLMLRQAQHRSLTQIINLLTHEEPCKTFLRNKSMPRGKRVVPSLN